MKGKRKIKLTKCKRDGISTLTSVFIQLNSIAFGELLSFKSPTLKSLEKSYAT